MRFGLVMFRSVLWGFRPVLFLFVIICWFGAVGSIRLDSVHGNRFVFWSESGRVWPEVSSGSGRNRLSLAGVGSSCLELCLELV